jgi:hypothetical protein
MLEGEHPGMKTKARERLVSGSVFLVACDGMAEILHVDADLVFAAGLEVNL